MLQELAFCSISWPSYYFSLLCFLFWMLGKYGANYWCQWYISYEFNSSLLFKHFRRNNQPVVKNLSYDIYSYTMLLCSMGSRYNTVTTNCQHYTDVIMGAMVSQITSLTIVYSTVYSGADQRKHQSPASLAFVQGINREPVNSPHKWPVTRKNLPIWWRHC